MGTYQICCNEVTMKTVTGDLKKVEEEMEEMKFDDFQRKKYHYTKERYCQDYFWYIFNTADRTVSPIN